MKSGSSSTPHSASTNVLIAGQPATVKLAGKLVTLNRDEVFCVLALQGILVGIPPAGYILENKRLGGLIENLWYTRKTEGEPEFWGRYNQLACNFHFLAQWRPLIHEPISSTDGQDSSSAKSRELPTDEEEQSGVMLDQVKEEPVDWLWRLVFPLGKLTMLDGDPGVGKSLLLCDLAARLTRGLPMPDGTPGTIGGVVVIAPEDGISDTILPRLARAGADLEQIICLNTVEKTNKKGKIISSRPFNLSQDLALLEAAIKRVKAKLVIIDPLMAVLGTRQSQRDSDIRALMIPLQLLVEQHQVACVLVRHLTKKGGENVLYRGSGSIAFLALARCALIAAHDPEDETRMVLAQSKNNLGQLAQSLTYRIHNDEEQGDARPYILWEEPSPITAKHLGRPMAVVTELKTGRKMILALLQEYGTNGLSPQQIAENLPGMGMSNIKATLKRMVESGLIWQPQRGVYAALSA